MFQDILIYALVDRFLEIVNSNCAASQRERKSLKTKKSEDFNDDSVSEIGDSVHQHSNFDELSICTSSEFVQEAFKS